MPRKRTRLDTAGKVANETGKLYREARAGTLPWADAATGSLILHRLRAMMETSDLEARLTAIEQALAEAHGRKSTPPHHHNGAAYPPHEALRR